MPVGVAYGTWNSNELVSKVFGILVEEVAGYHVVYNRESGSAEMIRTLGGCPPSMTNFSQCRTDPRRSHFTLENWEDTVTVEWDMIFREMGEFAPVNLGSAGYSGYDGVYILQDARERCQAETGLQLSYYSNFNASWFHPDRYAATVAMIAPHRVMNCTVGVNFFHPEYAKEYVRATGDTQATEEVDGRLVLKCFQERWFVAPSCRGNASNCVAVVTSGAGWGLHFMIQQAYFHNMPLAFASAEWEEYIDINLEFQSALYWWRPDETFVLQRGMAVVFPSHSVSEYKAGIYRTSQKELTLRKYAAAGLDVVADRVYGLAENLNIGDGDMANLLYLHAQSQAVNNGTAPETWDTACRWILSNTDAWQSWVPYQTVCAVGKGLVDLQNNFVSLRSEAVNCAVCPPGFASLKSQSTRVCSKCQPGFYQNSFRAAECLPCEPGTISSEAGSHHCTPCSLGSFANRSGMLACDRCGNGSQEELWTTSMQVDVYEETTWIQVQGASSAQFCFCVEGSFLWQGRCQQCTTGSYCRGSNQLEVLPGYFSSSVAPGEIYKCLSASHCPGGKPGTCTVGRDPDSLGCSSCLSMLRAKDGGSCGECDNGDYLLAVASVAAVFIGVGIIYYVLFQEQKVSQPGPLLITITSVTQLLTTVQILSVVHLFDIPWREPFASILEFLKIFNFNLDVLSIACLTPLDSLGEYVLRVCLMPVLMLVALLVHFGYLLFFHRPMSLRNLKLSQLFRTIGTIFMIWFIIVFSLLLEPFQCYEHPNQVLTLKHMYQSVLCNGQGRHMHMYIIGGVACAMPMGFLVFCTWIVLVEIPKGIAQVDTSALDAYFFLIRRLRPGAEIFSVLFQVRNLFVVLCPLVPSMSGKIVALNLVLGANLIAVVYVLPWRSAVSNFLDVVLLCGLLGITEMAALFVQDVDASNDIWVIMACLSLMVLGILGAVGFGIYKAIRQKFRKEFKFFLCHHKAASGSMARLLKIELQNRSPGSKTFVDSDDLMNLTRLFSYVAQDTDTFVVLGSPAIFTRKWCMGEMATAFTNEVRTVLLAWPTMVLPDEQFIENYRSTVPDIKELTKFGISLTDVRKTLRNLVNVETLWLPGLLTDAAVKHLVQSLTGHRGSTNLTPRVSGLNNPESPSNSMVVPIMVDPKNIESVAAALVLQHLLRPLLLRHMMLPCVMREGQQLPTEAKSTILICSENCFLSSQMQQWLLQAGKVQSCSIIPVIAEDNFLVPSPSFFSDLAATTSQSSSTSLVHAEMAAYTQVIRAVFQEIAILFVPQNTASTQEDLELRANKAAQRLLNPPLSVADKLRRFSVFSVTNSHLSLDTPTSNGAPAQVLYMQPLETVPSMDFSFALRPAMGSVPTTPRSDVTIEQHF